MNPDDIRWPEEALQIRTSRAGGAGGQHVNRTDSKVDLLLDLKMVEGIPPHVLSLFGPTLRVVCQSERSQLQNLREALEKLRQRLADAWIPPAERVATKVPKAQKRRRLTDKRITSEKKRIRRSTDE